MSKRGTSRADSPSALESSAAVGIRCTSPSTYSTKLRAYAWFVAAAIAVVYAFFAGFKTVADTDLGWQLATGRWAVEHHAIPRVDVLSYTAGGREWIYPVLSQVLLYLTYNVGGYTLLSWLGAAATVGAVAVLASDGFVASCLAIFAVPLIAARSMPRAEMFTPLLFAYFVRQLWRYHRTGSARLLWPLPFAMCLWVNLHLGFVLGLAMFAAYFALDAGELVISAERNGALERLRRAIPWCLACLAATLLNPWGPRIYVALQRQAAIQHTHNQWITEWLRNPVTLTRIMKAFTLRDPDGSIWWLVLAALAACVLALFSKRVAPVVILAVAINLGVHSARLEASLACLAVVIGGSILGGAYPSFFRLASLRGMVHRLSPNMRSSFAIGVLAALAVMVGVRSWDLATNRVYLRSQFQSSFFGSGAGVWFPEEATAFLRNERIPGNLYNEYSLGGFVSWQLAPQYRDYIDGRAIPFGTSLFFRSVDLAQRPLDSPEWREEAEKRNINAVFLSLDYALGSGGDGGAVLQRFCSSTGWAPVFLDSRAAVFVRRVPETANTIQTYGLDCKAVRFENPPNAAGTRGDATRFHYYLNTASILISLHRSDEARAQLDAAERIFSGSAELHYLKAGAYFYGGDIDGAVRELETTLKLDPMDKAASAVSRLYTQQRRFAEAEAVLQDALKRSGRPCEFYVDLGSVKLAEGEPEEALALFDKAQNASPFTGEAASLGAEFWMTLAKSRQSAWQQLADSYEYSHDFARAEYARKQVKQLESSISGKPQ